LSQIDIADIVGRVVVLDLSSSPVDTFNLHCLAVFDCAACWNVCRSKSEIVWIIQIGKIRYLGASDSGFWSVKRSLPAVCLLRTCKYGNVQGSFSQSTLTVDLKPCLPMIVQLLKISLNRLEVSRCSFRAIGTGTINMTGEER
jgi:hypothetical protein